MWIDLRVNEGITSNEVRKLELRLHRLQKEMASSVETVFTTFEQDSGLVDLNEFWPQAMRDNQASLFILKSDTIVFWSNNLPVDEQDLRNIGSTPHYVNLGNGWYVAQAFCHKDYTAIALLLVQTDYPVQNEFIQNRLNGFFQFNVNAFVSPLGSDVGLPVHSIDGVPLFIVGTDVTLDRFPPLSILARWLGMVSLLAFVLLVFHNNKLYRRNLLFLLLAMIALVGLRYYLLLNAAYFAHDLTVFSPTVYADSTLIPSLGDLGLHVLFLFAFILILFSAKDALAIRIGNIGQYSRNLSLVMCCIIVSFFASYLQMLVVSLTTNSNISFTLFQIASLSWNTLLAFLIMGMMLAELFMLVWLCVYAFRDRSHERYGLSLVPLQKFGLALVIFALVYSLTTEQWDLDRMLFPILFVVALLLSLLKNTSNRMSLLTLFSFSFVCAVYLSASLLCQGELRERDKRQLLAQSLSAERDPVAEMLLYNLEDKLNNDPYLLEALRGQAAGDDLFNRITTSFFDGYFQRYDIHYQVCQSSDLLYLENKDVNCLTFFRDEKKQFGVTLPRSSHFWFMNNYSGRICYLGQFSFPTSRQNQQGRLVADSITLFINLNSKLDIEAIGYPELLLDTKSDSEKEVGRYSYGKYSRRKLVSHYGGYDYSFELPPSLKPMDNHFFSNRGYSHYVYWADDQTSIVISKEELRLIDVASMLSYSLVLLFVFQLVLCLCAIHFNFERQRLSYRWRISMVMLASITVALTTLAVVILLYTLGQTEKRNMERIEDKMQSINMQLDQSLFNMTGVSAGMTEELNALLVSLSNAFYTDLNLYDLSGNLVASSRDEIFEKKLLGTKMNWEAYQHFMQNTSSRFIHREHIGALEYYSAYTTYYNRYGEPIAFVNLPYFFESSKFRNELLSLVGTIASIYVLLIILVIGLSIVISSQLTHPLNEVRQKMSRLDLRKQPEPIGYRGNDELGDLVREYNRMIVELAESAHKLADSERESAWRSMAQQIAHEIKNPLTPMKLGLQHALRMKKENRDGWQGRMEQAAMSVLEQIEVLTQTASEFSNFSRINKMESSTVDLSEALKACIKLFAAHTEVKIILKEDSYRPKLVLANKEQLQRVFTNLIKNSVQALEGVSHARIVIELKRKDREFVLRVHDNGVGITPEVQKRLFEPNFTSKTGGTGLGLAISRSIVESFGGIIVFVEQEEGACFEVHLPMNE